MKAVAVSAAGHQPTSKFVDDDDLAFFDHVIDVALEEMMSLERLVNVVDKVHMGEVVEIRDVEIFFRFCHALFEDRDSPCFFVYLEMPVFLEAADEVIDFVVERG